MDGRTRRRLETRSQLVSAGVELLRRGDEVSVSAVLDEAQVAHGTFYNHFSGLAEYVDQMSPPDSGERDAEGVEQRVAILQMAIDGGQLADQDARLLEIASRRALNAAVTRYVDGRFTDTAERDTAVLQMRLAGIPEPDIAVLIERVEKAIADL